MVLSINEVVKGCRCFQLLMCIGVLNEKSKHSSPYVLERILLSVGRDSQVTPLPDHIAALRDESISVLVLSLPEGISKPELESMFCEAGKITDLFIPVYHLNGRKEVIAFVCFKI